MFPAQVNEDLISLAEVHQLEPNPPEATSTQQSSDANGTTVVYYGSLSSIGLTFFMFPALAIYHEDLISLAEVHQIVTTSTQQSSNVPLFGNDCWTTWTGRVLEWEAATDTAPSTTQLWSQVDPLEASERIAEALVVTELTQHLPPAPGSSVCVAEATVVTEVVQYPLPAPGWSVSVAKALVTEVTEYPTSLQQPESGSSPSPLAL